MGSKLQEPCPFGQWTVQPATTALWAPRAPPSTLVPGAPSGRGLAHAALRTAGPALLDSSAWTQVISAIYQGTLRVLNGSISPKDTVCLRSDTLSYHYDLQPPQGTLLEAWAQGWEGRAKVTGPDPWKFTEGRGIH